MNINKRKQNTVKDILSFMHMLEDGMSVLSLLPSCSLPTASSGEGKGLVGIDKGASHAWQEHPRCKSKEQILDGMAPEAQWEKPEAAKFGQGGTHLTETMILRPNLIYIVHRQLVDTPA